MIAQIIIPARLGSSRLPNKMLEEIEGKPLIWWTVKAARQTRLPVMVATDSEQIAEASCCAAIVTDHCNNGTERCIEAARRTLGSNPPLIINWQGDSPTIPARWVHQLVDHMAEVPHAVGTIRQRCDEPAREGDVWASYDDHQKVTSFSRMKAGAHLTHRHVGLYAIRPDAFDLYGRVPSPRELMAGLEQNRWIDRGVAVTSISVDDAPVVEINHGIDIGLFKTWLESIDETV